MAVAGVSRRAPWPRGCSRLAEESLISSSWISSHWASVRRLSGIARSSCRRVRGDIGCGAFMAALSHPSTSAVPPARAKPAAVMLGKARALTDGPVPTLHRVFADHAATTFGPNSVGAVNRSANSAVLITDLARRAILWKNVLFRSGRNERPQVRDRSRPCDTLWGRLRRQPRQPIRSIPE